MKLKDNLKIFLLAPDLVNRSGYCYTNWFQVLEKLSSELILFDYRDYLESNYCLEKLNNLILEKVLDSKPDIIFYPVHRNELSMETFIKIKEVLPCTKIFTYISDDDWRHENHSRFLALYSDYFTICFPPNIPKYEKYGHKNIILTQWASNPINFYPTEAEKKIDVSLIGLAYKPRPEWIKYLLDNGIKVKVFGKGWSKYPEFRTINGGFLSGEKYLTTINQTKINLNFGWNSDDGALQVKGRTFEFGASKAFQITNFNPILNNYFTEDHDIVYFRNKEDLLGKVKYYLEKEEERNRIAQNCYENVIRNHTWEKRFIDIFKQTELKKSQFNFNKNKNYKVDIIMLGRKKDFNEKTIRSINDQLNITKKNLIYFDENNLIDKFKYDFVTFCSPDEIWNLNKLEFQMYAMECDKNTINLTDFQINEGSCLYKRWIMIRKIVRSEKGKYFPYLLPLSTIMMKKELFIKELPNFNNLINNKELTFYENILKERYNHIELPLIEFSKFRFNKKKGEIKRFIYMNSDLRRRRFFKECLRKGKIFKSISLLIEMIEREYFF